MTRRSVPVGVLIVVLIMLAVGSGIGQSGATEAPSGFDDQTNGFVTQTQFDQDRKIFKEQDDVDEGLGPVYNAQSCGECHQNPVTGGISQVSELRAGFFDGRVFIDHPGGSLIQDRAIDPSIQERVLDGYNVSTLRTALNTLGDSLIEATDDNTFRTLAALQFFQTFGRIAGQVITVPVTEAGGRLRVGRFGWKNQHASLLSFSADAYLNEMGITSPLQPAENTSLGRSVAAFDTKPDPDNNGDDVEAFARFIRATKAPPRDGALAATPDAQAGSLLFSGIGCAVCHVRTLTTAPAGTVINGGTFVVPPALGNKIYHPFGDFLLHDVGTGDGIVQNGGQSTRNKVRTAPLWGVRTRSRLMHDGASLTFTEAILRHDGEAGFVINSYRNLTRREQQQLLTFLRSL